MADPRPKRGQHRRPKDDKRLPLSMRITPGIRERLVADAFQNGRSITQEAEIQLQFAATLSARLDRLEMMVLAIGLALFQKREATSASE